MKNLAKTNFQDGFTVLMALYFKDDPRLFKKAVESVFKNTLLPSELLIVIDGPIGVNLEGILENLKAQFSGINIVRLENNEGLANALNVGLKEIKYPWVVRADADDINLPERFQVLADMVRESPDLVLIGSAILEVDKNGAPLMIRELPVSLEQIRKFAQRRNPFNHMTVAYRRECVLEVGGYPNVFLKEDYALWCHLLKAGHLVTNTKTVLVHATAGEDLYRRRGGWKYAKSEWQLQTTLVQCQLKGGISALIDGHLRALIFLAPSCIRSFFYKAFLRKISK